MTKLLEKRGERYVGFLGLGQPEFIWNLVIEICHRR